MQSSPQAGEIESLMEQASLALERTEYFKAERLAREALGAARMAEDFACMTRILMPLQEARRQRLQLACDVGNLMIGTSNIVEEMEVEPGCHLIQPPQVGADARRLKQFAFESEIPVAVMCREPKTQLGLCPIVAISPGVTVRAKIDPPDDWDQPDMAWFMDAIEALGDFAIESLDRGANLIKQVDTLMGRLDAISEHEGLHLALAEVCREAHREKMDESADGKSTGKAGKRRPK